MRSSLVKGMRRQSNPISPTTPFPRPSHSFSRHLSLNYPHFLTLMMFHSFFVFEDFGLRSEMCSLQMLLPLYSAVSARLTSCLGVDSRSSRLLSQGIDITKLQIHGTVGFLYHGIIEVVLCGASNEVPVSVQHQLIDFSRHSFKQVKQYLIDYGQMRTQEGFSVIQDSLCAFYDCLCVGMSSGDAISTGMLGPDANGNDGTGTGMWGLDADGIGTSGGDDANLNPSAPVQSVEQSAGRRMEEALSQPEINSSVAEQQVIENLLGN